MDVIDVWTGGRASALQRALRLTNERFAGRLGTAVRTVAKWKANADLQLSAELQEALDTVLDEATDQARARFSLLLMAEGAGGRHFVPTDADLTDAERRLNADPNIGAALEWLDRTAEWVAGTARQRVAAELVALDPGVLRDRASRRSGVTRAQVAGVLGEYYAARPPGYETYGARYGDGGRAQTSVLTHADWLDLDCALTPENDQAALVSGTAPEGIPLDEMAIQAAVRRIAETLETNTRMVDSPLYRLHDIGIKQGRIGGSFGMTTFVEYALTMDLLEGELVDAIAAGSVDTLPLRERLMPDARAVLDTKIRVCAGGALALCAIAGPAEASRRAPDYLILVQERGGKVLNAASRLAVIPKCFHEPLTDYRQDTQIGSTLRREMEEELFGRDDVDGTAGPLRHADPMHPSRLSPPMRWLTDHSHDQHWQMECTGFGLNLVSGNFEFASLIVIHDETFWTELGGDISANWESDRLRQYSSMDRQLLAELIGDDAWSNEGLFALLQGLRRLEQLGGDRVDLPSIELELR